jgi:hypothetical protein
MQRHRLLHSDVQQRAAVRPFGDEVRVRALRNRQQLLCSR